MTLTCDCGQQFTKVSKYMSHVRTYHPTQFMAVKRRGFSKTQLLIDLKDPNFDTSKRDRFIPDQPQGLTDPPLKI